MLQGESPCQPIKRTTSMTEFTFDLNSIVVEQQQPSNPFGRRMDRRPSFLPCSIRQSSADFVETAPFLKFCFLCKRRLVSSRDIYIYRGESAFCSPECRHQQMIQDEKREKSSLTSKREDNTVSGKRDAIAAVI